MLADILFIWSLWQVGRIAWEIADRAWYAVHRRNCYFCRSRSYAQWRARM